MSTSPLLRKHMPELDVWRGIAIALVVAYHAIYWTEPSQPGRIANLITNISFFGWLGVNLFFVLSGFLITGILLDTKSRPGYFGQFYRRRVLRIVPAYVLCLVLLVSFRLISSGGLLRAVTFSSNYSIIPASQSYGPLWTLSVEEQFYLFWPLLVLLSGRHALTAICLGICTLEPVLRYLAIIHGNHMNAVGIATFLIADSLALGALGALFFRSSFATLRNALVLSGCLAAGAFVIIAVGISHGLMHRSNPVGAALQTIPFNLLFASGIFSTVALRLSLFSGPLLRPLRALGDISYGLYLFHPMVLALYDRIFPMKAYRGHFTSELMRGFICITFAIGMAWLSRWYYEELFLQKKKKSGTVQLA